MVNEGIVLGHKISERGIEVDKAKVDAIEKDAMSQGHQRYKKFPWSCWFS